MILWGRGWFNVPPIGLLIWTPPVVVAAAASSDVGHRMALIWPDPPTGDSKQTTVFG